MLNYIFEIQIVDFNLRKVRGHRAYVDFTTKFYILSKSSPHTQKLIFYP